MFNEDLLANVVIVDNKGDIVYFTERNIFKYGLKSDEIIGSNIGNVYENLSQGSSSLYNSIKKGSSVSNLTQDLKSYQGTSVKQKGATFPLIDNGKIIGAIEFADIINFDSKIHPRFLGTHKRKNNGTQYDLDDIITRDPYMLEIKKNISKISMTNSNVMIYGDTGTGKELVAQSIHNESLRRDKPFVSQNCGAIPETLVESTLFGTVEGSFTGAKNTPGIFEMANGGTLFLDEINSISQEAQVRLLRAVETKQIRRLGDTKTIPIDIKLIVATNEKAKDLLEKKIIRQDLFYRLSVVQINLPPLKDRPEDIGYLSDYFIDKFNKEFGMDIKPLDSDLIDIFKNYPWPGNIRELENVIESSFNLIEGNKIKQDMIPYHIVNEAKNPLKGMNLLDYMEDYEKQIILNTYNAHKRQLTPAANSLNISRQLLKYKLDKYDLIEEP